MNAQAPQPAPTVTTTTSSPPTSAAPAATQAPSSKDVSSAASLPVWRLKSGTTLTDLINLSSAEMTCQTAQVVRTQMTAITVTPDMSRLTIQLTTAKLAMTLRLAALPASLITKGITGAMSVLLDMGLKLTESTALSAQLFKTALNVWVCQKPQMMIWCAHFAIMVSRQIQMGTV